MFKLCGAEGYTWAFKVYAGKEKLDKVVTELILFNGLYVNGRILYTDNWYTSVSLPKRMIDRKTHLIGTLRSNLKGNPQVSFMRL